MPKVRVHNVTISLDGYAAGPNQRADAPFGDGPPLHEWMFATRTGQRMMGGDGGEIGIDDDFVAQGDVGVGATVMGRNMFGPIRGPWTDDEWRGWWGNNPPYHHPVFVLTHHVRAPLEMEGGTTFHFVDTGIEAALDQATAAAGGKDVRIGGGASTIQQYLRARLIDELHVVIVPVVMGADELVLDGFIGAVRIDRRGETLLRVARGRADRAHGIPNDVDTRFAIASAVKGMTALAVVSLVVDGTLALDTTARSILGRDLTLIGDDVTLEHLLANRSGIGDYVDEDDAGEITDHVLPVPVHRLDSTEAYLAVLDGHPPKFAAGEQFAYCNSGFVVLALLAERASGVPFAELVRARVCGPAQMARTSFLRSDELPGDAAIGYLGDEDDRTNVLHLPVLGSGDGGIYSTIDDIHRLWRAFMSGRIVPAAWVDEMVRPRSEAHDPGFRYGLGFWLHDTGRTIRLEGYDAGVSFRSEHDPEGDTTWTVVSNTSEGAWPVAQAIAAALG